MSKKEVVIEPKSDLGKLLLMLVQSVGTTEPRAFMDVNVENAIAQVDALAESKPTQVVNSDGAVIGTVGMTANTGRRW